MDKKKELEITKSRLQKAYSMTIEEQRKWSKKIRELELLAAKLEEDAGQHFADEEGIKLLIKGNKELSMELSEQRWGKGINKYLEQNPKVNQILDKVCNDVDHAFRIKSTTVLKLKIEKYKETYKFVEKTYCDSTTLGYRELTPDESKIIEQIGW